MKRYLNYRRRDTIRALENIELGEEIDKALRKFIDTLFDTIISDVEEMW